MIKEIFMAGAMVMNRRTTYNVLGSLVEEVGELSKEVNIINGRCPYKEEGEDGVLGEAVDVIICAVDLIKTTYARITEDEIMGVLNEKLNKWKSNAMAQIQKQQEENMKKRERSFLAPPPSVEQPVEELDLHEQWKKQSQLLEQSMIN